MEIFELAAQADLLAQVEDACGTDTSWACRNAYRLISNETFAKAADFLVARPLKIILIVIGAWVLNRLARRGIRRLIEEWRAPGTGAGARLGRMKKRATPGLLAATGEHNLRKEQRAETLAIVGKSVATGTIYSIAFLLVLGELSINLGPFIAGAGIIGVAVGFGAQSLVKDFLSGIFMLIEDQYGIGDVVDLGEANGTVEAINLRTTRLRDVEGTVWHVPNGEIRRVGNKSQQWAKALLDIDVAYDTDVRRAQRIVKAVGDELWHDDEFGHSVLEEPQILGVEVLGADGISIRMVVKTKPGEQFGIARELRTRIKERFDQDGIEIPFPQRTLWVRHEEPGRGAAFLDNERPPAEPSAEQP